jgi:hypothetical protein
MLGRRGEAKEGNCEQTSRQTKTHMNRQPCGNKGGERGFAMVRILCRGTSLARAAIRRFGVHGDVCRVGRVWPCRLGRGHGT